MMVLMKNNILIKVTVLCLIFPQAWSQQVPLEDGRDESQIPASFYSIQLKNGTTMLIPEDAWTPELLKISQNISEALAVVTRMVNDNPFPEQCNFLSERTFEDFKYCMLFHQWHKEFPPLSNSRRNDLKTLKYDEDEFNLKLVIANRTSDQSSKDREDCLINTRNLTRPVPDSPMIKCYGAFGPNETSKYLDSFIYEIVNDWRYTYDFILYDDKWLHLAKENRLWYLIGFLKEVATYVTNPYEIVDTIRREEMEYFGMIEELSDRLKNVSAVFLEESVALLLAIGAVTKEFG